MRGKFMKKVLVIVFLFLMILSGCGGKKEEEQEPVENVEQQEVADPEPKPEPEYVDILDSIWYESDNRVFEIYEAKYQMLDNGSYKFFITIKAPKGYTFTAFNSGEGDIYKSDFIETTGEKQDLTFTVSEKKMREMDSLMANVWNQDGDSNFFMILDTKSLFAVTLEDSNDGTYEYIDITEDGEADYGSLETTTIELENYSYYKINEETTRYSVTFTSAPEMEVTINDDRGNLLGKIGTTEGEKTTVRFTMNDEYMAEKLQLRVSGTDGTGVIILKTENIK